MRLDWPVARPDRFPDNLAQAAMGKPADVTSLLARMRAGDRGAEKELFGRVHGELAELAARILRHQRNISLETLGLVNESYVRLVRQPVEWQDRGHFFAVAAKAMRSILVDHARRRRRRKRGGGRAPEPLDDVVVSYDRRAISLVDLDDALATLAKVDERAARVVDLRFFCGLSLAEIAEALGVALRTIERDWEAARAWLHRELS